MFRAPSSVSLCFKEKLKEFPIMMAKEGISFSLYLLSELHMKPEMSRAGLQSKDLNFLLLLCILGQELAGGGRSLKVRH